MNENPALYEELSTLLKKIIEDFINKRLAEAEYLERIRELHSSAVRGSKDDAPADLADDPDAAAFHGYLLTSPMRNYEGHEEPAIAFAKSVSNSFRQHNVVDMFQKPDVLNKVRLELDDYMYDTLKVEQGIGLTTDEMDVIQDCLMTIAERRMS